MQLKKLENDSSKMVGEDTMKANADEQRGFGDGITLANHFSDLHNFPVNLYERAREASDKETAIQVHQNIKNEFEKIYDAASKIIKKYSSPSHLNIEDYLSKFQACEADVREKFEK